LEKKLIVLKFGTASITKSTGEPDLAILADIARQVALLHETYRIVIVSSGAVGAGKRFIRNYDARISQKKAAAAIGNPLLLKMYDEVFGKYDIQVAQSLLERQHFSNRTQFLQLKETYEELWENQIIPIANENDVISNRELKFSDNDELATLIASGFGADRLLLCTASGGLLDEENKLIKEVKAVDADIMGLVKNSKTALGSGGMASKLTFTRLANKMGIQVNIFGLKVADGILKSMANESGTAFLPLEKTINAKNKWMASAGVSVAKLVVDAGAAKAVLARKSLLAVGLVTIEGDFQKGELIEIYDTENNILAIGKSKIDLAEFQTLSSKEKVLIVHADDIVIL
jgi:glutamate 5-kinase